MRNLSAIGMILFLLGISLFAGCSRQKTIAIPGGGKMTVKEGRAGHPKEVTIENKKGSMKINTETKVSEAELGMPLYPGAAVGQSVAMTNGMDKNAGAMKQVVLTTPDAVEKVKAFYMKAYPKASTMDMNNPDTQMTQIAVDKGKEQKLIMISRKKGEDKTQIILHIMAQK